MNSEKVIQLRNLVWGYDIPSPTVPEYREHHEQIQSILNHIDHELMPQAELVDQTFNKLQEMLEHLENDCREPDKVLCVAASMRSTLRRWV